MQLSSRLGPHTGALAPAHEQMECTAVRHCSEPVHIFMVQSVRCEVHIHPGVWGGGVKKLPASNESESALASRGQLLYSTHSIPSHLIALISILMFLVCYKG